MKYTPVGVDIAKHLIQVHFIDADTGEVVDKQLRSRNFLEYFSNRKPCLIGMEACGGSQHRARELTKLGQKVRLLQARFVKAFVMGNKNDVMDARAIWMAVQQSGTKTDWLRGKIRMLGISKRGDTYLRTLFIHGARIAALLTKDPGSWIT